VVRSPGGYKSFGVFQQDAYIRNQRRMKSQVGNWLTQVHLKTAVKTVFVIIFKHCKLQSIIFSSIKSRFLMSPIPGLRRAWNLEQRTLELFWLNALLSAITDTVSANNILTV